MLLPLHGFLNQKPIRWEENDFKYFIQNYLQDKLQSSQLICESLNGGRVMICVNSPALSQAVRLAEFDLQQELKKQADYDLKELIVRVG